EIPVNVIANFETSGGSLFVGAGPYYALGVAGKIRAEFSETDDGITNTAKIEEDIKFGNNSGATLKSGDFGINFLIGYELTNGLNIHTGYGLGLSNINTTDTELTVKNRVFSVGLGFSF